MPDVSAEAWRLEAAVSALGDAVTILVRVIARHPGPREDLATAFRVYQRAASEAGQETQARLFAHFAAVTDAPQDMGTPKPV